MTNDDFLKALHYLDQLEKIVWDNEHDFLQEFSSSRNATQLISVSFTGTLVKIVYLLEDGQHIADHIRMDDFYDWMRTKKVGT